MHRDCDRCGRPTSRPPICGYCRAQREAARQRWGLIIGLVAMLVLFATLLVLSRRHFTEKPYGGRSSMLLRDAPAGVA